MVVETPSGRVVEEEGWEKMVEFDVEPDMDLEITMTTPEQVKATLVELTPAGERIPAWEHVRPNWPESQDAEVDTATRS